VRRGKTEVKHEHEGDRPVAHGQDEDGVAEENEND
jgi:hypothetical protein